MKLMNSIAGEHQALPEEMLTKRTSIIYSAHVVVGIKMTAFPTLSCTSTCEALPFYTPEA